MGKKVRESGPAFYDGRTGKCLEVAVEVVFGGNEYLVLSDGTVNDGTAIQ